MPGMRVILQARCSSSRLPRKVLLPVAGYPSVVLSLKRASNTGLDLLLATSTDSSDDLLAAVVEQSGFPVMRGPLDDVLSRFVMATDDLDDDQLVVRLTADNVVPDGAYIQAIADALRKQGGRYLGPAHPRDGMPHGLSVEVFTVRALREADRFTPRPEDREHVTPFLRRREPDAVYRPPWARGSMAHLGCTVDTRADYERVARLFEGVGDPLSISSHELCQRLAVQEELVLDTRALAAALAAAAPDPSGGRAEQVLERAIDAGVLRIVVDERDVELHRVLGAVRRRTARRVVLVTRRARVRSLGELAAAVADPERNELWIDSPLAAHWESTAVLSLTAARDDLLVVAAYDESLEGETLEHDLLLLRALPWVDAVAAAPATLDALEGVLRAVR